MTIRKKMILILLAATIIPLCLVGLLGYFNARRILETVRMENLKSIADLKAKRIEDFFAEIKNTSLSRNNVRPSKKMPAMLAGFSGD